jgi:hypothetical protein
VAQLAERLVNVQEDVLLRALRQGVPLHHGADDLYAIRLPGWILQLGDGLVSEQKDVVLQQL